MSALTPKQSVRIRNDSGEEIPPRSVVAVMSVETTTATNTNEAVSVLVVDKYQGWTQPILVTGPVTIPAGTGSGRVWPNGKSYGLAYSDDLLYVSVDDDLDDPENGEMWGPVPGQWTLSNRGNGFLAMGHSENGGTPKRSMFFRQKDQPKYWAKVASGSSITAGTFAVPTNFLFNVWLPDLTDTSAHPKLLVATNSDMLGVTGVNHLSVAVPAGTPIRVEMSHGIWSLVLAECP